ncbi:MAG: ribosome small subunit-dependent GTPase A [Eubacterium sp.]|nr:ribosome small subunit-dependent GTPase A [Eubacterium sp.]
MRQLKGKIIRGIGGFYYVEPDGSTSLLECRARGALRHQKIKPMVGDLVEITEEKGGFALEKILPRKNTFVRPPVANVDVALIVFAATNPEPDLLLLDKLLIASELKEVTPVIVLTKKDLAEDEALERITAIYAKTPYKLITITTDSDVGIDEIEACIAHKTAFLAGPSGVGKSTLANRLCIQGAMETGALSQKLNRGRHTTRHVELLPLRAGGFLLDTPGFSSLKLDEEITAEALHYYFPEFEQGGCKFNTCLHDSEPQCAVKAQVAAGTVAALRYEHYIHLLHELKNKRSVY